MVRSNLTKIIGLLSTEQTGSNLGLRYGEMARAPPSQNLYTEVKYTQKTCFEHYYLTIRPLDFTKFAISHNILRHAN